MTNQVMFECMRFANIENIFLYIIVVLKVSHCVSIS